MPRIRTVKPEMWTDGKVVRLSDAANLLFIALLNQADDDGRLKNDPKEIECRAPRFWGRVNELLKELSDAELIVVYGLHSKFLQIKNFSKHQVIDRKRPSEIPSPNARRTLAEDSTKGKEGKGRERKGNNIPLTPLLGEFETLWDLYPRKLGRTKAFQTFRSAVKKDTGAIPRLRAALDNYLAYLKANETEEKFIKHGSTWFGQWEEWEKYEPRTNAGSAGDGAKPVPGKYAHLERKAGSASAGASSSGREEVAAEAGTIKAV